GPWPQGACSVSSRCAFFPQFWQYGEWVEVVVDDRLPTKNGKLLFLHSEESDEFWSALLEKAYAKLNGSYEALSGGSTVEGFEDFTGGISEFFDLKKPPPNLYQIIRKALRAGSLLACSIERFRVGFILTQISSAAEAEAITTQKLVKSHAYSVTGVEEVKAVGAQRFSCYFVCVLQVDFRGRPEKLIRLRNPWGEVEWTGAWSDDAPEWSYIDPRQKEELDKKAEDGEFWQTSGLLPSPPLLTQALGPSASRMSFLDFLRQFSRLEICNLSPDSLSSEEVHKWNLVLFNGRWARGSTAGGCQNYPATYWTNPQFKIHLDEVDEEGSGGEPYCTVLLGLMQKNRRRQKKLGQDMLSIGYAVYKVHPGCRALPCTPALGGVFWPLQSHTDAHLGRDFFLNHQPSACCSTYVNLREVSGRLRLPPGEYLVVPSTFRPFEDCDFCLRVFSEKKAEALCVPWASVVGAGIGPHPSEADQEDSQFKSLFEKLAGKDAEISASELKMVLNGVFSKRTDIKFDGFDINTCREMISLMDEIYREADDDHLGTIDAHEMRTALRKADSGAPSSPPVMSAPLFSGFTLNNQVQQTIAQRYACSKLGVDFNSFVACMIRLETLFSEHFLLPPTLSLQGAESGRARRQSQTVPLGSQGLKTPSIRPLYLWHPWRRPSRSGRG
ncbi:Calpain-8, partial [Galemys pyrenaicus]